MEKTNSSIEKKNDTQQKTDINKDNQSVKDQKKQQMNTAAYIVLGVFLAIVLLGRLSVIVNTKDSSDKKTVATTVVKEEKKEVSHTISDEQRRINDSIYEARMAEKKEQIKKLTKNFRFQKDEFEDRTWVYHTSSSKYRNVDDIYLYFQQSASGKASNLRFVVQYEADDWLFIEKIIFNVDGDNITFFPKDMDRDNNSRIWEWCDEPASNNRVLITSLTSAKNVKVKFVGEHYYDTRKLSSKELKAMKETFEYYSLLDGSF